MRKFYQIWNNNLNEGPFQIKKNKIKKVFNKKGRWEIRNKAIKGPFLFDEPDLSILLIKYSMTKDHMNSVILANQNLTVTLI